jgi:PPOX class probable F420-dependent enzyme
VDRARAVRLAGAARVARLGTIGEGGRVDLVPCTFAFDGELFVTAVDHKPKSTTNLRRLDNVRADGRVTVLIDHYDDDWSRLWWVRLRGLARVVEGDEMTPLVAPLVAKYPQYGERPPSGPAIVATIDECHGWAP